MSPCRLTAALNPPNWLPEQGSNLQSLGSEPSVLPITPSGNRNLFHKTFRDPLLMTFINGLDKQLFDLFLRENRKRALAHVVNFLRAHEVRLFCHFPSSLKLALREGLEPPHVWLTASRSAAELPENLKIQILLPNEYLAPVCSLVLQLGENMYLSPPLQQV
jgi:hypothetical protein